MPHAYHVQAIPQGLIREVDPTLPYLEQIKRLADLDAIKKSGLNIVVDAMHGAGAG